MPATTNVDPISSVRVDCHRLDGEGGGRWMRAAGHVHLSVAIYTGSVITYQISQGSVETRLRRVVVFNDYKLAVESRGGKMLKVGQHLTKLRARAR